MSATHSLALPIAAPRTWSRRVGWGLSGLVILFFVLDGAMKLPPLQIVTDTMTQLGWPADPGTAQALGTLMLCSVALYAYRPTSLLGAILITGYLGGAVATHTRIGSPLLTHTLFGVYLGVMAWAGLWLRDPRLQTLMPLAPRN